MKLGLLPLGRPTFDVPYAEEKLAGMLEVLEQTGVTLIGPKTLLFDGDATRAAMADIATQSPDAVLILQVTFTDAAMTVAAANTFADLPLHIWAVPEPRLGGRLRLNAFCGLNLASHALGLSGRAFGWLYADPTAPDAAADLGAMLAGKRMSGRLEAAEPATPDAPGQALAARLQGRRIAKIGAHPDGFDTCAYDGPRLKALTGLGVDEIALATLFDTARAMPAEAATALRATADGQLDGLAEVDADQLDKSLRLKLALDKLRADHAYDAFAIRCWPETFTEYGGAVCGPVSMLGEARIPCACEADVYGAATQLLMQEAAGDVVFLADLVDIDPADNTGVLWHCGQAPASMAAARPSATIHTNRKMPLLFEFTLKPGPVTLCRISQAHGAPKLILSFGEMLAADMAFTGTSGTIRFDRPAGDVLADVIASGLEHHMCLAYGDHRAALRGAAAAMGLGVLEI